MSAKVVFTSGCWDLLHIGHVRFLQRAKAMGDKLVVGVATDKRMREEFDKIPIIPFEQRCEMLRALSCVDVVEPWRHTFDHDIILKHNASIRVTCPNHYKGPDYYKSQQELESKGIEYITIPRTPNISTTMIKEKCYEQVYEQICEIRNKSTGSNGDSRDITCPSCVVSFKP